MLDSEELLALARHNLQKGDLEGALSKIKQVMAGEEAPVEAYSIAARVYAQLSMFERAREHYQGYLQQRPDAAHEMFEIGMTFAQENKPAEALEEWSRALAAMPDHPPALFFSADMLARQGRAIEARRHLDVLLKSVAPDNMYVERAKQLVQALEMGSSAPGEVPFDPASAPVPYGRH